MSAFLPGVLGPLHRHRFCSRVPALRCRRVRRQVPVAFPTYCGVARSLLFRNTPRGLVQLPRGVSPLDRHPRLEDQTPALGRVWACVNLIADAISPLPIDRYQRVDGLRCKTGDDRGGPGVRIDLVGSAGARVVKFVVDNVFSCPPSCTASMYPRRAVVVRIRCACDASCRSTASAQSISSLM